jgi:glutathione S-transferase
MSPFVLITIPFSHFCEKSRWMLDHAGIAHREEPHLPMFHMAATKRHGGRSVPLLVTPTRALTDSTDIMHWVDGQVPLLPTDPAERAEALALEEDFDQVLGPHVRRIMYFHLLGSRPAMKHLVKLGSRAEARLGMLGLPIFKMLLTRSLKLSPDAVERSLVKVRRTFDAVAARLADGRPWLMGETFGAVDITFAALGGAITLPDHHPVVWPPDALLPPAVVALRDEFRHTPGGDLIARAYRLHRKASVRFG